MEIAPISACGTSSAGGKHSHKPSFSLGISGIVIIVSVRCGGGFSATPGLERHETFEELRANLDYSIHVCGDRFFNDTLLAHGFSPSGSKLSKSQFQIDRGCEPCRDGMECEEIPFNLPNQFGGFSGSFRHNNYLLSTFLGALFLSPSPVENADWGHKAFIQAVRSLTRHVGFLPYRWAPPYGR